MRALVAATVVLNAIAGPRSFRSEADPYVSGRTAATSSRSLQGEDLAIAWLTGFLTRSDPADERWVDAVRELTTPDLLKAVRARGPHAFGMDRVVPCRVVRIVPLVDVEQSADTESSVVLSFTATVTDGYTQVNKPLQLFSLRGSDGRWLVAPFRQPYSIGG